MKSKAWNWSKVKNENWETISDDFLPTALQWKQKKISRVLDLGCGIGRHSIFLAEQGFEVDAFDLSESGLQALRTKANALKLDIGIKKGDMLNLPYDNDRFDAVIAFHSIYHTDYVGLQKVIDEITRVLKENGELYLTLNSKESDAWQFSNHKKIDENTQVKTVGLEKGIPHTYVSHDQAIGLLSDYEILKIRQIIEYDENKKSGHFFIHCQRKSSVT